MSRIRHILGAASVETAVRKRKCHHDSRHHVIPGGTRCLTVKDPASGGSKNYCTLCAVEILDQAERDLESFRSQLRRGSA
jgi:hypothetical protein